MFLPPDSFRRNCPHHLLLPVFGNSPSARGKFNSQLAILFLDFLFLDELIIQHPCFR